MSLEMKGLGEQEFEVVAYGGRDNELIPSRGLIYLTQSGRALHHRPDCMYVFGGQGTITRPDSDKNLWRRLLESGRPDGPELGLVNGIGKPVTLACEQCVLRPVMQGERGKGARRLIIDDALRRFRRVESADIVRSAQARIEEVQRDFPRGDWPTLSLSRYALGLSDSVSSTYCHRMEYATSELGSIAGGSARKHAIYFRRDQQEWWYADSAFTEVEEAWEHLRQGFVDAFEAMEKGRLAEVDEIEPLRSCVALTAKSLYVYFPDRTLPIYSRDHVRHFLGLLSGDSGSGLGAFASFARLKELIDADDRFEGWDGVEVMNFLYGWDDPRQTKTVVKIAPGADAKYWNACLKGGYICVGWDDVGDLTAFPTEEDFRAAFDAKYSTLYKGNQGSLKKKSKELWRLLQLRPGDRIVANRGTSEILAVGTVIEPGYSWRGDRSDFNHTLAVDWDVSYAMTLPQPEKRWAFVTVTDVSAALWRVLENHQAGQASAPKSPTVAEPLWLVVQEALRRRGQAILFGPPGTGKTYSALRFALWWLAQKLEHLELDPLADYGDPAFDRAQEALSDRGDRPAGHLTRVTFHPAYGYEDFIEGFRPVQSDDGGLRLKLVDGVFKRVCAAAEKDLDHPYVLLIDEINRGDLPKIFGELITLLETDKRGMTVVLPQSGAPFAVPRNVYVIGTMNTADRSIRLLDSAVRRRFGWVELRPNAAVLEGANVGNVDLGALLSEINRRVLRELDRERQIGHSYFLDGGKPVDSESALAAVIRYEILPLLQEYAYDDYTLLEKFLGRKIVDVTEHQLRDLSDDALVDALRELQVESGVK